MELRIKAAQTRAVSARELSRRMADLIDEMETEGLALVVLRYGRPAALSELGDVERTLLLPMADCAPEPHSPDGWRGDISAYCRAFTRLEFARLAERNFGVAG